MFSSIKGRIRRKTSSLVEVEVNGLGFEVLVSLTTLARIGDVGEEVLLYTIFLFRDETYQIYGFATLEEKEIFQELIRISGIGPKIAIAILSYLEVEEFIDCVVRNDIGKLTKLPGVGKKIAERVLLEFRGKVKKLKIVDGAKVGNEGASFYQEAISALVVLGYQENKVKKIVLDTIRKLPENEKTIESVVKQVLRELNK
ncbi:MAG: Holliday junction branch migration protein RuvA [Candidatus Kapaibacteriota bacterium]|jgi:Holliday junction DNA helicase RuvA